MTKHNHGSSRHLEKNTQTEKTHAHDRVTMPLAALAVPMYLENLLRTLFSSVDVFMVSAYSEKAVAAVGLINQFTFFLILVYMMVGEGTSTLISQYLGARKIREAGSAGIASFVLGTVFAIILSLATVFGAHSILGLYSLESEVYKFAWEYLVIYGSGSVFVAFNIVQGTILRAYGYPKDTMWANMIANLLNVFGNAIALYGLFGLPVTGVVGVAVSTVVSQLIACIILAVRIRVRKGIVLPWRNILKIPCEMYRKLLFVGVPTAGENVSYSVMQMVIIGFIAQVGTAAMNAHVYTYTILRFVFMPALTVGSAGQLKVGYWVGAKKFDIAERKIWVYFSLAFGLSMTLMLLCYLFRFPIIHIFTKDTATVAMVSTLFLVSFFRESGRIPNIVVIPALKGSGDVYYPVICGLVFMWGIGVVGAWFLGLKMGLGLAGVWIAIAADEWIRGIAISLRWKSGAWKSKALVHHDESESHN
ncbi:MAG: MATE family efflux transporter [Fibrobacter sp.]|nr:MATE family efflux transporter [Fibrobacter sp.]